MRILLLLIAVTIAGCCSVPRCPPTDETTLGEHGIHRAPPRAQSSTAPAGPTNKDMWLGLEAPITEVDDDDVIHYAQDRVAVLAQVPFPLHLFLLKIDAAGRPQLLYPKGESVLVSGDVRLPAAGWVELAVPQIDESLVVIAVLEGEYMGQQDIIDRAVRMSKRRRAEDYTPESPFIAAEGSYTRTLKVDAVDAIRVDVWAEDETHVWIDIEH